MGNLSTQSSFRITLVQHVPLKDQFCATAICRLSRKRLLGVRLADALGRQQALVLLLWRTQLGSPASGAGREIPIWKRS